MNTSPIVGLLGKKRAGKDSVATTLVNEYGFKRIAFADALKEACITLNPTVGPCSIPSYLPPKYHFLSDVIEELGWEIAKGYCPGVRETLRNFGQAITDIDKYFWVNLALEEAAGCWWDETPVVITDVRFIPEYETLNRQLNSLMVRVDRPGLPADDHRSETELDDYPADYTLSNDGDLEHLAAQVRQFAEQVLKLPRNTHVIA